MTKSKNIAMIIYNRSLSVSPLTTHLPIKYVSKKITASKIINNVKIISSFWKKYFKSLPKIAITGLNPHCESLDIFNEDEKIIKPSIKFLKKKRHNVSGPYPADTIFLKNNRQKLYLSMMQLILLQAFLLLECLQITDQTNRCLVKINQIL
jgi:4-hydroxythreonine-4-phosphate dehydrogenase